MTGDCTDDLKTDLLSRNYEKSLRIPLAINKNCVALHLL
jgi:hypothetical protein